MQKLSGEYLYNESKMTLKHINCKFKHEISPRTDSITDKKASDQNTSANTPIKPLNNKYKL